MFVVEKSEQERKQEHRYAAGRSGCVHVSARTHGATDYPLTART